MKTAVPNGRRPARRGLQVLVALVLLLAAAVAAVAWLNLRGESPLEEPAGAAITPQQVERGRYLARAGHCAGCHTARGGLPYAGGRGIETPFGTVVAGNLTPDPDTGLGRWRPAHFWRALHNGRSMDGRLLYPAFPYPHFTRITREDSDAIFAFLQQLAPVRQPVRPHALRFPYNSQAALAVWRALFFRPGALPPEPAPPGGPASADWQRGRYLVQGLGHCSACHAPRNLLGATLDDEPLAGATVPMQDWYAPALNAAAEAGVAGWRTDEVVQLLQTGRNRHASVSGPMAGVVVGSTQYLSSDDLRAMALYLQSLPQQPPPPATRGARSERGEQLYERHCADCHGRNGRGVPGIYPALAGNRAVTLANPANLVLVVANGGFGAATQAHPRPFGMPPFGHQLSATELAAVLTHIRGAWGNQAPPVSELEVLR